LLVDGEFPQPLPPPNTGITKIILPIPRNSAHENKSETKNHLVAHGDYFIVVNCRTTNFPRHISNLKLFVVAWILLKIFVYKTEQMHI